MNAPDLKRPARNRQSVFLDEVIANHFRSIVEEMSTIVLRSAHTTFIKETQDYATTLTSVEGEMFAYPHNTGVTSLLGMPVAPGIAAMEKWAPGDVMLTNDPYTTAGMVMHLPDLTLLKPIFAQGKLLCFAWTFMHCSDVGGALPGSINMANTEVFQEGIRIRPVKLYDAGVLNQTVWNLIADNCRIPDLNWGDVGALLAGLNTSEKRMLALVEKIWSRRRARGDLRRHSIKPRRRPVPFCRRSRRASIPSSTISRTTCSAMRRSAYVSP